MVRSVTAKSVPDKMVIGPKFHLQNLAPNYFLLNNYGPTQKKWSYPDFFWRTKNGPTQTIFDGESGPTSTIFLRSKISSLLSSVYENEW